MSTKTAPTRPAATGALAGERTAESPRRRLSARQADTVDRLVEAALDELRASGYEGLTVRRVAARVGVTQTTAYAYFGSKDHLVAEVFWRRLQALPRPEPTRRSVRTRVAATLAGLGELVTGEPELAAACTTALLSNDPDVRVLRDRLGQLWHERLQAGLGDDGSPEVLRALELCLSGALLNAGMGHLDYAEVVPIVADTAVLLTQGDR